jgi:hypothetical protein
VRAKSGNALKTVKPVASIADVIAMARNTAAMGHFNPARFMFQ